MLLNMLLAMCCWRCTHARALYMHNDEANATKRIRKESHLRSTLKSCSKGLIFAVVSPYCLHRQCGIRLVDYGSEHPHHLDGTVLHCAVSKWRAGVQGRPKSVYCPAPTEPAEAQQPWTRLSSCGAPSNRRSSSKRLHHGHHMKDEDERLSDPPVTVFIVGLLFHWLPAHWLP